MTNNYCSNCGTKVGQMAANFCSKCGQNLKKITKTIHSNNINLDEDVDDYIEAEESNINLDLSKLKDKIKIHVDFEKSKPVTIGEFIKQAKSSNDQGLDNISRPKFNLKNDKDILKMMAEECSSSREKSSEVI
jgi:hypothetical protein